MLTTNPSLDDVKDSQPGVLRVLQTKDETKAFYNKIARVYDLLSESAEAPIRDLGLQRLDATNGERVLEIGFGTGNVLLQLAQKVGPHGQVYGLDIAEQMLALAAERVCAAGLQKRITLICGDAATLPYEASSIDAIFTSFTLELFDTPDIPVVLAECKRVLRPDGRIVVVSMSKEAESGTMVQIFEWTHKHFPNFLDCRPIFVRRAVEAAGFHIESVDRRSMWVPVQIVVGRKRRLRD